MVFLSPTGNKYGYSPNEQLLMLLTTGITNVAGIPACVLVFRTGRIFEGYIAAFTVFTSFMYHAMESVTAERMFLGEGEWHRLDNIGSITCFITLLVHLMDNNNKKLDFHLNMSGFIITIIFQESDPWNLLYSIIPVALYLLPCIYLLVFRDRKPVVNTNMRNKWLFWFAIAFVCFAKGLNEFEDYLRLVHGFWHLFVGVFSFYFWQIKITPGEEFTIGNFWKKDFHPKILLDNSERDIHGLHRA